MPPELPPANQEPTQETLDEYYDQTIKKWREVVAEASYGQTDWYIQELQKYLKQITIEFGDKLTEYEKELQNHLNQRKTQRFINVDTPDSILRRFQGWGARFTAELEAKIEELKK